MRFLFNFLFLAVTLVLPTLATGGIPPEPYLETSFATEGPLSLIVVPDGSGQGFTEAQLFGGIDVDGTLTIVLYDDQPGWGDPIPNYPYEDLWLEDESGGFVSCRGGTCPDGNTDENGVTSWSHPLEAGGAVDPHAAGMVGVAVNGWVVPSGALPDLRLNSPDINGDLVVNLTDVQIFSTDYFGHYTYRSDFIWDGTINLSDVVHLARAYGAECP